MDHCYFAIGSQYLVSATCISLTKRLAASKTLLSPANLAQANLRPDEFNWGIIGYENKTSSNSPSSDSKTPLGSFANVCRRRGPLSVIRRGLHLVLVFCCLIEYERRRSTFHAPLRVRLLVAARLRRLRLLSTHPCLLLRHNCCCSWRCWLCHDDASTALWLMACQLASAVWAWTGWHWFLQRKIHLLRQTIAGKFIS